MKTFLLVVGLLALGTAAGCGGSDTSARTAATTAAASTPSIWAGEVNTLGLGAAPTFPETLDGWKAFGEEWSLSVRAFEDQYSPMSGPGYESDYPASMNGCDSALSLVRWRVISKGVKIRASWQHATAAEGVAMGDALTGDRGWMILDGCQIPMFQFASAPGEANLVDVTVTAKRYEAAA